MILIEIIKLKLRMPSTLRLVGASGIALAYVGIVCKIFAFPYDFPFLLLVAPGAAIWWLAMRRLKRIERGSR